MKRERDENRREELQKARFPNAATTTTCDLSALSSVCMHACVRVPLRRKMIYGISPSLSTERPRHQQKQR